MLLLASIAVEALACSSGDQAGIVVNVDTAPDVNRQAITSLQATVNGVSRSYSAGSAVAWSLGIVTSAGSKALVVEGIANGVAIARSEQQTVVAAMGKVVTVSVTLNVMVGAGMDAGSDGPIATGGRSGTDALPGSDVPMASGGAGGTVATGGSATGGAIGSGGTGARDGGAGGSTPSSGGSNGSDASHDAGATGGGFDSGGASGRGGRTGTGGNTASGGASGLGGATGTGGTTVSTTCGNGRVEGAEACDDGDTVAFDGCSPTCQMEPQCGTATSAVGACKAVCGDGILARGTEECDDGNVLDGDGCSHDCKVEAGYTCRSIYDSPPSSLTIPVVVRDFRSYPAGHLDFDHYCCADQKGITQSVLDAKRKPVYAGTDSAPIPMTTGKTAFDQWYRDVSGTNYTFYQTLTLLQNPTSKTVYAMSSDTDKPWYDRCGFYPLDSTPRIDPSTQKIMTYADSGFPGRTCAVYDGLGFGNEHLNHNYSFTSELHYWFQYQGNESLKFTGDDDMWVFVNGTLAVDLGGIHNRAAAALILALLIETRGSPAVFMSMCTR